MTETFSKQENSTTQEQSTTENSSKFKTAEQGGRFNYPDIADLEKPIKRVFEQMLESIERGEYDLIIGIDASGRIPTFIFKEFFRYVYAKTGHKMPEVRFMAGEINQQNSEERIQTWQPAKKVLIVDDTIDSGSSIQHLTQALKDNNILFDVAVVSKRRSQDYHTRELKRKLGAENIYFGEWGASTVYGARSYGGVLKEGGGETFSRSYKSLLNPRATKKSQELQETIKKSRSDAEIVIRNLITWYEAGRNQNG